MKPKRVILRELAQRDVDEAIAYYLDEGAESLALEFVDALEAATDRISRHPGAGSPRDAVELDLPGLRCWPMRRFSYLLFYIESQDHVDVWRVLHGQRDVAGWLARLDLS